jgi:D-alanyl-D-alanine carboxypeptidase
LPRLVAASLLFFSLFSCLRQAPSQDVIADEIVNETQETDFSQYLSTVLSNSRLPRDISANIRDGIASNPAFIIELFTILQTDPYFWILVDKEHALSENYEPRDLVQLRNASFRVSRSDLLLRREAAESLEAMAAAARRDGLTLVASSAYRTYEYQVQLYQRYVREIGQQAADRISARPGHSQHQLGLVIDFGSIDDSFAATAEGRWLTANASRFGWSLSYPQGYEEITGYSWESWHFRYVGIELAEFIDSYFDGIQQYALRFIHEYKKDGN